MMRLFLFLLCMLTPPVWGQTLSEVVEKHRPNIIKGSVKTAPAVIAAVQATQTQAATDFLNHWQNKSLWYVKDSKEIVLAETDDKKTYALIDIETGAKRGAATKKQIKQIKPNSGLRKLIRSALVSGMLTSSDINARRSALEALSRDPKADHLTPLRKALSAESDVDLWDAMARQERLLTLKFDPDDAARVVAIKEFSSDLSIEARGAITSLLDSRVALASTLDATANTGEDVKAGSDDLSQEQAADLLRAENLIPDNPDAATRKAALIMHINDNMVGGVPLAHLSDQGARDRAYLTLTSNGLVPEWNPDFSVKSELTKHRFVKVYKEPSVAVTDAARSTLAQMNTRVDISKTLDLLLDGISLASIYFLAAIGLAITFGVMRVINMAHGEFIMMGAYTGYVVQLFVVNHTLSLFVALPLAFCITFAAGVLMERLVIRHLYHRPLETLLATFGISIALQQLAKNIFGTQARPLTSPDWLDGALVINEVIQISWIRVAIFVLACLFFGALLLVLTKTRLGLETRAVTQNPRMAASMGINPDRINMLTFGLGSGIAGVAGVAIGLYAKVTSELGADYIVQSFMTVVVGGVGNIFGTLAGASLIGFLQKSIEWFNPSNTLAAQTFMIVFIIIFIQFRPRGIIALRGRAAGD